MLDNKKYETTIDNNFNNPSNINNIFRSNFAFFNSM